MDTIAVVVSVQGTVWAQAADGSVRVVSPGDALVTNEQLVSSANARIVLDFGDGLPVTLAGEQTVQMSEAASAALTVESDEAELAPETAALLNDLLRPPAEASPPDAGEETDESLSAEGFAFVELVRIGSLTEADGISPLRLGRIDQELTTTGIAPTELQSERQGGISGVGFARGNNHDGALEPAREGFTSAGSISVSFRDVLQEEALLGLAGSTINVLPGSTVTLVITDQFGNTLNVSGVTVQGNGRYSAASLDVSALTDGPLTVVAETVDLNGNSVTAIDTVELDVLAGALNIDTTSVDDGTGTIDIGGSSTDVAPGENVAITVTDQNGNTVTTTVQVQPDGSFDVDDLD
ncbi:MAG: retention module-containing protein, partial [Oceanicaulis sp.]|nr:retention module-containing protein [Oceanicaulis sp.]